MKVLSIAGYHHTGKTTVAENLIKELRRRDFTVQSIKDIHNEQFTMEREGSNSWRHWEAGSEVVFARGLNETYQVWHSQLTLKEMLERLDADYVIVEGMKEEPLPRIICAETFEQIDELLDGTVVAISGKVSNNYDTYKGVPILHPVKDIKKIADIVIANVFKVLPMSDDSCCTACGSTCRDAVTRILSGEMKRTDCVAESDRKISIRIGDKDISMVPFVQDIIYDAIYGMVKNLKGFSQNEIQIVMKPER